MIDTNVGENVGKTEDEDANETMAPLVGKNFYQFEFWLLCEPMLLVYGGNTQR